MKKIKIKYINVLKLVVLVGCLGLIIHDLYMLFIYPIIFKTLTSFTVYGFLTFVLAVIISTRIIGQIKSVSPVQTDTL